MAMLHWVILLLSSFCYRIDSTDCPDGWMSNKGSCYLFGHDNMSFLQAGMFCANHSAMLVRVEATEENTFLKQFFKYFTTSDYWIGMTDSIVEGTWVWYGTLLMVEYFDWGPGEPQDFHNEDCAVFGNTIGFTWADVKCDSYRKPVCERESDFGSGIVG